MKDQDYTLEYFINKFEAIPENKWTTGKFVDPNGCMCAYGHCGAKYGKLDTKESEGLFKIDSTNGSYTSNIVKANDGQYGSIRQLGSTPKERVVNYLKSLRA